MQSPDDIDGGTVETTPLREAEHDPLVGTVFGQKYQITELLGSGGMSAVYKARQMLMNRWVAIKVLRPELIQDNVSLQRFQQESKAASMLNHPNVLAVHDFDVSQEGVPYLVMDLLQGHNISSILSQEGHMHPARCVFLYSQACSALAHAHSKGVIHRDIKPSNLMVVTDENEVETVKLVDFGIAKLLESTGGPRLTMTGEIFGSPSYMSPEQCSSKPLDGRSDVYSLGCVLYESLMGRRPFDGSTMIETILMHVNDPPTPFKELRPDLTNIPDALEAVVLKSMAKDPNDRYQSMTDFDAELRASYRDFMATVTASKTKPSIEVASSPASPKSDATNRHQVNSSVNAHDEPRVPDRFSYTGQSNDKIFTCAKCFKNNPLGLLNCQYCGQSVYDPYRVASDQKHPCRSCGSSDLLNSQFCTACGAAIKNGNSKLPRLPIAALVISAISILAIAGVWYWHNSSSVPFVRATDPWLQVTPLKVSKKNDSDRSSLEPMPDNTVFVTGDTICYRIEGLPAMPEACHIYLLDKGSGLASLIYHSVESLKPGQKLLCPGEYTNGRYFVQAMMITDDPGVDKLIVIASPQPIAALESDSPNCPPIFERAMKLLVENPKGLLATESELVKAGDANQNSSQKSPTVFLEYFETKHRPK